MDLITNSPLNKAHNLSRKADYLAEKGNLDEASLKHHEAALCLLEALKLTNNNLAIESIQLQREYHIRKQEVLRLKKANLLAVAEAARVEKEVIVRAGKINKKMTAENTDGSLQKAIYRTFDEADSLLELLQKKDGIHNETIEIDVSSVSVSKPAAVGVKKPKEDSDVIEELKFVNSQLRYKKIYAFTKGSEAKRNLITQLMTELSNSEKQVSTLKKRIMELESNSTPSSFTSSACSTQVTYQDNVDLPPLDLPSFETS